MTPGTNATSPLPWDIPLWMPDYAIFFGVLYLVLAVLGIGLALVVFNTIKDANKADSGHAGH